MDIQLLVGGGLLPYQTQPTDAETIKNTAVVGASGNSQTNDDALAYSGDQVNISEEGRLKSSTAASSTVERRTLKDDRDQEQSEKEQRIESIKKRIEEIKQQMNELSEDDTLSQKQKQVQTQALTQELLQLNEELGKLQSSVGLNDLGGTSAEGMADSLT